MRTDEADWRHACGVGRDDAGRRILDNNAVCGVVVELGGRRQEQIRRGFAFGNVALQLRFEETQKAGHFQARANAAHG